MAKKSIDSAEMEATGYRHATTGNRTACPTMIQNPAYRRGFTAGHQGLVQVFDWLVGGESVGCGTQIELTHWVEEGVHAEGEVTLGAVLTYEPASEDARRQAAWARWAAKQAA